MTEQLSFDPGRTAVLSMDMQAAIVSIYAKDQAAFLGRAARVLKRARAAGAPVIHVKVGFRPGFPEISERNALFSSIKKNERHRQIFEGELGEIHPAVAPQGEDIVVVKHRVSAFFGTDLDMILRAKEVDTLVLFGIATSGVVLSTLIDAFDADYRLIVIRDCCADQDAEVHACLVDKLFAQRATVASASEFLAAKFVLQT
ncbi:MAG TPA: isochorismatase family cysteine hydrolase [Candidatus Acidoferrum sp.]|nr:isochorismatase family cysteine hydrolase [Candidatus Acidoferrum sp.]